MLDLEHDDQNDNPGDSGTATGGESATPPPRRRRAATRPAGPPSAPTATTGSDGADAGAGDAPAAPPAKKTAKRSPRKTAATAESAESVTADRTVDAPAKRAPRKRVSKKAAAAPVAEAAPEQPPPEPSSAEQPPAETTPTGTYELAPSESALLAAVESAQATGEAASVIHSAELSPVVQESWFPSDSPAEAESAATGRSEDSDPGRRDNAEATPESAIVDESPVADESPVKGESGVTTRDSEDASDQSEDADDDEDDEDEAGDGELESDQSESDENESAESESDEGEPRRRRRRRGGRRRRRGGSGDGSADGDAQRSDSSTGQPDEQPATDDSTALDSPAGSDADPGTSPEASGEGKADDADDDGSAESGDGQRRRRRRRRRRGEDNGSSPDDPADVVVRVREPGRRKSEEPAGIEGSTRLEAKRQRRREGREAGRRRAPILSEAEFLTRRESVARAMVIRQREDLIQIAVLEDDILVEHYVDRDSAASLIGNVYLGRVQNVLPSMEAAFIDIGRGRNAVLYAGEVDWDSFGAEGQARKVERVLKSGQPVLVQVTKDPVGAKGARLTNHVSIPGRYIVYAPGGHLSGISRKLPDTERKRLKDILADLVPDSASVIVRTAAEGASEDELVRDVNRLKAQWEDIEKKVKAGQAPQLLYAEPDLTLRIVRDLFTEDFAELLVAGDNGPADAYDAIEAYVGHVAPHLADRLKRWAPEDGSDIFASHRIDEQIAKALERKVFLPSGGSLVIDRTEAMTVIDVNTGKFTGTGGNLEATVTSNNLEAAEEIVRQLRLRDLGGIIVIDFIDMVLPSNRELLLRRLVECLGRDRTRHQVAEVTSLGLVQMTRKKIGTGLLEAFSTECEVCHGRGYEIHDLPVESQKQADGGARPERSGRQRSGAGGGGGRRGGGRGGSGGGPNGGSDRNDQALEHSGETPAPVG